MKECLCVEKGEVNKQIQGEKKRTGEGLISGSSGSIESEVVSAFFI